jgi:hypothetical protein
MSVVLTDRSRRRAGFSHQQIQLLSSSVWVVNTIWVRVGQGNLIMTNRTKLASLILMAVLGIIIYVVVSSPAGKPSRLRYVLIREGMTRAEVEEQLGPGNALSEYGMKVEGPGMIHHGMPAENVELVLRWGYEGPTLIRVAFSDGKVCWKSITTFWL